MPNPLPNQMGMIDWMSTRLKLKDLAGNLVYFTPNRIQARLLGVMQRQRDAGLPIRIIILKARQEGCSTLVQMLFLAMVQNMPNLNAFVCAHDDDATTTVFRKAQLAAAYLPDTEQKATKYSSRKEIVFAPPHNSQIRVQVPDEDLDAGGTNQLIHVSELARWKKARLAMLSLMQTLPDKLGTICVIESTAQGEGGEFHKRWLDAMQEQQEQPGFLDGFIPVFFSWMDNPEYKRTIPSTYKWGIYSEEERELQEMGVDDEQLYWRRWKIKNDCGGDVELFMQEYPATPEEAFLASGRHAIMLKIRKAHHMQANKEEPRYAQLVWKDKDRHKVEIVYGDFEPGTKGCWRIFREPVWGRDYSIGGDVTESRLTDPNDPKSKIDQSAIGILDRSDLFTAALYVGRPLAHDLGHEMLKAAWLYNEAWVAPEINAMGTSVLDVLKQADYNNISPRTMPVDKRNIRPTDKIGWQTNRSSRELMIADWLDACRQSNADDRPHVIQCLSKELANEEDTFIINEDGKREHKLGETDDILFAFMIALQVHYLCPRERVGVGFLKEGRHGAGVRSHAYMGGYDPGPQYDRKHVEKDEWVTI